MFSRIVECPFGKSVFENWSPILSQELTIFLRFTAKRFRSSNWTQKLYIFFAKTLKFKLWMDNEFYRNIFKLWILFRKVFNQSCSAMKHELSKNVSADEISGRRRVVKKIYLKLIKWSFFIKWIKKRETKILKLIKRSILKCLRKRDIKIVDVTFAKLLRRIKITCIALSELFLYQFCLISLIYFVG